MNNMKVKELIRDIVIDKPSIKATELVTEVMSSIYKTIDRTKIPNDLLVKGETILNVLEEMVANKEIVEVEFVTPQMNYRIKSLYFPKGTEVTIVSNNVKEGELI